MTEPRPRLGRRLVLATHNAGKLAEFRDLFASLPRGRHIAIVSADELGLAEPEETGATFEANALTKAREAAAASGEMALSDDSGLCVAALGGDPGVRTADWATTEHGRDFDHAMRAVEDALAAKGASEPSERRGYFCAVLCLCAPDGTHAFYRGEAHGHLVWPGRGDDGFGYDPVFQPDGHERTFGEMTAAQKHSWRPGEEGLSHRAKAFGRFAEAHLV